MTLDCRVLLVSNSTVYGRGYLDHVQSEIRSFLGSAQRVLFFPFALYDRDAYAATARSRFDAMGYSIESVHQAKNPHRAIEETDAIFVGGGNTFRLLKALQDLDLVEPIRQKVSGGAPYIGSSAGSNVAGPTIKTTKDMPIVQPRSFESLGLVTFQISPHYLDPDPNSHHMGETQEERILQFLEEKRYAGRRNAGRSFAARRRLLRDAKGFERCKNFSTRTTPSRSGTDLADLGTGRSGQ
jgi:dipeptidase E